MGAKKQFKSHIFFMLENGVSPNQLRGLPKIDPLVGKVSQRLVQSGIIKRSHRVNIRNPVTGHGANFVVWDKGIYYKPFMNAWEEFSANRI